MSRLSREHRRGRSAAGSGPRMDAGAGVTPIEVRVPVAQDGTPVGGATVGGMPVVASAGETLQEAVLNYLHRLTLATGHPVLASIHDERIGCVVPIRVHGDGSSEFTGEPVRVGTPAGGTGAAGGGEAAAPPPPPPPPPPRPVVGPAVPQRPVAGPVGPPVSGDVPQGPPPRRDKATHLLRAVAEPTPAAQWTPPQQPEARSAPAPGTPVPPPSVTPPSVTPDPAPAPAPVARPASTPTHVLRALPESAATRQPEQVGTPETPEAPKVSEGAEAVTSAAEETPVRAGGAVSTFVLRAVPEQAPWITVAPGLAQALPGAPTGHGTPAPAPGTVSPPTGAFGPAPTTATPPPGPAPWEPAPAPAPAPAKGSTPTPDARPNISSGSSSGSGSGSGSDPDLDPYAAPAWKPTPAPRTVPVAEVEEVKEPPVRGFDSVAEAVLAPESGSGPDGAAAGPLAAPMARINEAVKQGRIEEAAAMAEEAVQGAAATLGPEHPDVLRLRELTAYIAYLAGDALRSFHLSLDLARLRRRARDPRGAYGNVQSAAAAWRAVRDPVQGLHLGRDLIGVWTEVAAEPGPAAEDLDQLESARNRMGRLAERARTLTESP